MRTTVSIALLVGAFIAVPLYFATRPDSAPGAIGIPDAPGIDQAPDPELLKLYCARHTAENEVTINTGPDCSRHNKTDPGSSAALSISRDGNAIVITGSDP